MSSQAPSSSTIRTDLIGTALLTAFHQLSDDSAHAPATRDRLILAKLAAREVDMLEGFEFSTESEHTRRAEAAIADFHRRTRPQDLYERLVKTYVSFNLVQDFLAGVASSESDMDARIRQHLASKDHVHYVLQALREALQADQQLTARLSLWGRRVMGETLAVVRHLVDSTPGLVDGDVPAAMSELTRAHSERMSALGLAP